jgi:hypothetical protein
MAMTVDEVAESACVDPDDDYGIWEEEGVLSRDAVSDIKYDQAQGDGPRVRGPHARESPLRPHPVSSRAASPSSSR